MATKIEELVDRVAERAGIERAFEMKEGEDQLRKAMAIAPMRDRGLRDYERAIAEASERAVAEEMKRRMEMEAARTFNIPNHMFRDSAFWGDKSPRVFTEASQGIRTRVNVPPAPSKSRVAVSADPGADEEYRALAKSLGVYDAPLVNMELEAFLAENCIEVYPLASVETYMNALCAEAQQKQGRYSNILVSWHWYPLRKTDVCEGSLAQYLKPVPFPVLQTVKLIADRFLNAVRFFVTDVKEVKDPFLGVSGVGAAGGIFKMHVIERWDEPKYRS